MSLKPRRQIAAWLLTACAMIVVIVIIGGATRLTQSGLSITDWEPIRGIIPPLTEDDWHHYFEAYRASPEYQKLNPGMSLDEFRTIFWWEYTHRMVARLFGLVLVLPMIYFALRRWLRGTDLIRAAALVVLTGAQAVLGWAMVQTGLDDEPYVSHFHLAAHLGVAMVIFAIMWWWALQLLDNREPSSAHPGASLTTRWALGAFGLLVFVQSIWGGFVAGLDAGRIVTTFPKMGEDWIYPLVGDKSPLALDLVANPFTVQFIHRTLGVALLLFAVVLWVVDRLRDSHRRHRRAIAVVASITVLQVALGIATLVTGVPTALGVLHQVTGLVLFAATLWALHHHRPPTT